MEDDEDWVDKLIEPKIVDKKEYQREYGKKHYLKNKDKYKRRGYQWMADNPERNAHNRRKVKLSAYNLTIEEYNKLLKDQNNVCAICKNPEIVHKNLSVDHCHETKKVRGLLCIKCNSALGLFKDNLDIVESALEYLRKYK